MCVLLIVNICLHCSIDQFKAGISRHSNTKINVIAWCKNSLFVNLNWQISMMIQSKNAEIFPVHLSSVITV